MFLGGLDLRSKPKEASTNSNSIADEIDAKVEEAGKGYVYTSCELVDKGGYIFFDWKRHKDILIDKKKYNQKDEKSSHQRKLNYKKLHCKTNELFITDHSLWSTHR